MYLILGIVIGLLSPSEGSYDGLLKAVQHRPLPRRLEEDEKDVNCDSAFLQCINNVACAECFNDLHKYEIDWASIATDIPCDEVISFLHDEDICKTLDSSKAASEAFCTTFHSCVFWADPDNKDRIGDDDIFDDDAPVVVCSDLTECDWEGMHPDFIGDGICHENLAGCYNSAVCNWDGGDCCKDTCSPPQYSYAECGHDGYACRDPKSDNCDPDYQRDCMHGDDGSQPIPVADCKDGFSPYLLELQDSFGDGWDTTKLMIVNKADAKEIVFEGKLEEGSFGVEPICLDSTSCYSATATGGNWGREVSWDVRGISTGSPSFAGGGSPTTCEFSVKSVDGCVSSCTGRPHNSDTKGKDYKDYKDMVQCLEKQCFIQLGACAKDSQCNECLSDDMESSCHSIPAFRAVVDCGVCRCTEQKDSDFCESKGPNIVDPSEKKGSVVACTPGETMAGGEALMDFEECADFSTLNVLVSDFNQNSFGDLDTFESCAHKYHDNDNHDGKTALECLQFLIDAKDGKAPDEKDNKVNTEAVKHLANSIYTDAEKFCECAKKASEDCPLCPSFKHFKTLLYEGLDACMSLDQIDCASWQEFAKPCQDNVQSKFGSIDLGNSEQCKYIKSGCGEIGPFPAFRRLDCKDEVTADEWEFHNTIHDQCSEAPTPTAPVPVPTAPTPTAPAPTPYRPDSQPSPVEPYRPDIAPADPPAPYQPDSSKPAGNETGKSRHIFRKFVLATLFIGLAYLVVKFRHRLPPLPNLNFRNYRRMQRNFGSEDMYHGLALDESTTFQPASLPPPPDAMGAQFQQQGMMGSGQCMQQAGMNGSQYPQQQMMGSVQQYAQPAQGYVQPQMQQPQQMMGAPQPQMQQPNQYMPQQPNQGHYVG